MLTHTHGALATATITATVIAHASPTAITTIATINQSHCEELTTQWSYLLRPSSSSSSPMSLETEAMVFAAWASLLSLHHSSRDIAHAITLLCRILRRVNEEGYSENSGVLYAICACEMLLRILEDFEDATIQGDFCDMVLDLVYHAFTTPTSRTAHYSYSLRKAGISILTTLCSHCSKIPAFFDSPMIEDAEHADGKEACRKRSRELSSLLVDADQWEIQEDVEEKVVNHRSFATEGAKEAWEPKTPKSPREEDQEKSQLTRRVEVKADKLIHTGFSDSEDDETVEKESRQQYQKVQGHGDVAISMDERKAGQQPSLTSSSSSSSLKPLSPVSPEPSNQ